MNNVQRCAMHGLCIDTMKRLHAATVFEQMIPAAVGFKEANSGAGLPITHHAPKSANAKLIRAVYGELLERIMKGLERSAA
jgi:hypothetical protein